MMLKKVVGSLFEKNAIEIFAIIILAIFSIFLSVNRYFDADEFQHMHIAWSLKEGAKLYLECYDHHGPLFALLNSFIWKLLRFEDSVQTFFSFRVIAWLIMAMLVTQTYWLAKKMFSTRVGVYSALILMINTIFVHKAIEVRPDTIQNLFMLIALYVYFASRKVGGFWGLVSGFCWGVSIFFNLKMIIPFILFLLIIKLVYKTPLRMLVQLVGLPVFIMSLWTLYAWKSGILPNYYTYGIVYNFGTVRYYLEQMPIFSPFGGSVLVSIVAAFLIINYVVRLSWKGRLYSANKLFVILYGGILFCSIVLLRRYTQWYLIFLPVVSIMLAVGACSYDSMKGRAGKVLLYTRSLLVVVLLVLSCNQVVHDMQNNNKWQISNTNYILKNTNAEDQMIFFWDTVNQGAYVFRPNLLHFWNVDVKRLTSLGEEKIYDDYFMDTLIDTSATGIVAYVCPEQLKFFPRFSNYLKSNFISTPENNCFYRVK